MAGFAGAERIWASRLGTLRNVVRQELIARQLGDHVLPGMTVLDVGCGQGTQALRLAEAGCSVTGLDPSPSLLDILRTVADEAAVEIEVVHGDLTTLPDLLPGRRFDVVCAHGLLMYLDDRRSALATLAAALAPGGFLSVTFRNGAALAFRPGIRHDWPSTLKAFDDSDYVNELGVKARADTLSRVTADLSDIGLQVRTWYGVRVFTDPDSADEPAPTDQRELTALLDAEDRAGRSDPYRQLAAQVHVIAAEDRP
jgi:S-adenosylmethionine-dependent methyltransferase